MIPAMTNGRGQFLTNDGTPSNFSRQEFLCRGYDCAFQEVAIDLIDLLQTLRNRIGVIHVVSGIRCEKHNRLVGGVHKSYHVPAYHGGLCLAADVSGRNVGTFKLSYLAAGVLGMNRGGVGLAESFIHVDVRSDYGGTLAAWSY